MKITVQQILKANIEAVWRAWATAAAIKQWNAASDDWHSTEAMRCAMAIAILIAYSGERDRSFRPIVTAAHELVLRG